MPERLKETGSRPIYEAVSLVRGLGNVFIIRRRREGRVCASEYSWLDLVWSIGKSSSGCFYFLSEIRNIQLRVNEVLKMKERRSVK